MSLYDDLFHQIRNIVNEYRNGDHWSSQGMERIGALLDGATPQAKEGVVSEPLFTWTPAQFRAHEVLIAHQRKDIGGCICGWGVDTGDLGRSHPGHILDELGRAGLRIFGLASA